MRSLLFQIRLSNSWAAIAILCAAIPASAAVQNLFAIDNRGLSATRAKEFLAIVCPGHVAGAGHEYGCDTCPDGEASADAGKPSWTIQSSITGHFTEAEAENIVLSMEGCEPHATNFGGSVLLAKRGGRWERNWYQPGALTARCRKIPLADHREILFCEGSYTGSGTASQSLYTMDLSMPEARRFTRLLLVEDTMAACFAGTSLRRVFLEKVEFPDLNADGMPDLRVSIQTGNTKKFTEAEISKLCPDSLPRPATRRSTMEFLFQATPPHVFRRYH
ncbi:MAG: hypothetical protein ABJF23_23470 [Bryobacteraceae bacterium]